MSNANDYMYEFQEKIKNNRHEEAGDFIYQIAMMNPYVTGQVFRMDGGWI